MKNKKGSITIFFVFIIMVTMIVLVSALFAPLGVKLTTDFYDKGEDLLIEANATASNIQDPAIKAQIQSMLGEGTSATVNNIEVFTGMYKYGWVIAVILTSLVLFLITRIRVETGGSLL